MFQQGVYTHNITRYDANTNSTSFLLFVDRLAKRLRQASNFRRTKTNLIHSQLFLMEIIDSSYEA